MNVEGVKSVVRINTPHAKGEEKKPPNSIAVVGDGYWQVRQGLAALKPQSNAGPNAGLSSDRIATVLNEAFAETGTVAEKYGDAQAAMDKTPKKIEAVYSVPFLAHGTMEPMNATADVSASGCDIWAPTQAPGNARNVVADLLGLRPEQVRIHTTYLGAASVGEQGQTSSSRQR